MIRSLINSRRLFTPSLSAALIAAILGAKPGLADASKQKNAENSASKVYVMSDLLVKDFRLFRAQLQKLKNHGVAGVSVDVWWGLVQAKSGDHFDWTHYDQVFAEIRTAGLKAIPILSTHACGGNVGDSIRVALPQWFIEKHGEDKLAFVSEEGNKSLEYASFWATPDVLPDYENFWRAFSERYQAQAASFAQIVVSLGPSGELHFPSYHQHDRNAGVEIAQYPHRGVLQAFSAPAVVDFQAWINGHPEYAQNKLDKLRQVWGLPQLTEEQISPELIFGRASKDKGERTEAVNRFFTSQGHFSVFGRDLFQWYRRSLLRHGEQMLGAAVQIFQDEKSAFAQIPLVTKIPGVHWGAGTTRLPELTSGLISTSDFAGPNKGFAIESFPAKTPSTSDYGYLPVFESLHRVRTKFPKARLGVSYTAAEISDLSAPEVASRGETLVRVVANAARAYQFDLIGENALGFHLYNEKELERLFNHVRDGTLSELVLLRMGDALQAFEHGKIPNLCSLNLKSTP